MLTLHNWTIKRSGASLRVNGIDDDGDTWSFAAATVRILDGEIVVRGRDDSIIARLAKGEARS